MMQAARELAAEADLPGFVCGLSPDWQRNLLLHAMRIAYSRRPVTQHSQQVLDALFARTGHDRGLFALYDRGQASDPNTRRRWLDELELPAAADREQIETAYRRLAKKYHPDRLHGIDPEMVQLASAKFAAVSAACRGLTRRSAGPMRLCFLTESGEQIVNTDDTAAAMTCYCAVCSQKNRIPSEADFTTARCGCCHALLGMENHHASTGST